MHTSDECSMLTFEPARVSSHELGTLFVWSFISRYLVDLWAVEMKQR
jgi:hypothetical protein